MAQIWVSLSELGELCGCSPKHGLAHAQKGRWERVTGRDGVTRVLLPDDLAFDFMRLQDTWQADLHGIADSNVRALRGVLSDRSGPRREEMPGRLAQAR